MAINPLTGQETNSGLFGSGVSSAARQARQYPAWMTDINARGIGMAQQFNAPRVAPIDIPRGDGLGGFNDQSVAPRIAMEQPAFAGFDQPTQGGDGGGFVGAGIFGGMSDGLGPTGNEQMGNDANAAAGNENASAGPSAEIAGMPGMYHGGIVTRNKLRGPDPNGPDDGHVAMDLGEGVLTAKAVRHYGPGIVERLNKLQVPKGAFGKR